MKRDILNEINRQEISVDEAEKIYDEIMDGPKASEAPSLLGLSKTEWTAFCHGATFEILSNWRINGWPVICLRCGKGILVDHFGWMFKEIGMTVGLVHVDCANV
jgi:hypothetical protein